MWLYKRTDCIFILERIWFGDLEYKSLDDNFHFLGGEEDKFFRQNIMQIFFSAEPVVYPLYDIKAILGERGFASF